MIHVVLILAGMVGPEGREEAAGPTAEVRAEYNARKEKTPDSAAEQSKLALWCEQNGLAAEAQTHYAAVVRLDPTREAAWRKLGFRKVGGRWLNEDEIAEEAEQKKADKLWAPRLRKIHRDIHGGKKQEEAEQALLEITDPRAIPAAYQEFGGSARDQEILVQLLGQVRAPLASKVLAMLAIYGKSPEVRRRATETLRGRDPDDYLPVLARLVADPLKYDVRPVGGPGSPGVLFVEGQRFNVRRVYAPPRFTPQPGDLITYDADGLPVLTRPIMPVSLVPIRGMSGFKRETDEVFQIPFAAGLMVANAAAVAAQGQLQGDVAALDRINAATKSFNDLVLTVARDASGKDPGDKPGAWRDAVLARAKPKPYARTPETKPTFDELVPLAYVPPVVGELTFMSRVVLVDS